MLPLLLLLLLLLPLSHIYLLRLRRVQVLSPAKGKGKGKGKGKEREFDVSAWESLMRRQGRCIISLQLYWAEGGGVPSASVTQFYQGNHILSYPSLLSCNASQ